MAQASAIKTYDAVGNREDLTDVISTITRHETPLFSSLEKVPVHATYHEWQLDSLSTGSDNAKIEGADFTFALPAARTRVGNYAQIFNKTVEVSMTQEAVSVAGLDSEYAYQLEKRMKEIATDVEEAIITGTGNSGASGTARRVKGLLAFITTNVETGTGTGSETLTENMYNNALQSIWTAGGRPGDTYVNGFQKRKISAFASNSERHQDMAQSGELRNYVSVYHSDFGVQTIHLNPFMDTDKVLLLQKDMVRLGVLRGIKSTDVATIGDAKRGALIGEMTLEVRNQAALGKITGLATS